MDIGEDEDVIAEALMEHGPLSIALNAAWMQFYHGGISHPLSYLCDPEGLGWFEIRVLNKYSPRTKRTLPTCENIQFILITFSLLIIKNRVSTHYNACFILFS